MKQARQVESDMPAELQDQLEKIVSAYGTARTKAEHLRKRLNARIAPLRMAMGEIIERNNERIARVDVRRRALSAEFLALWSKHLPGLRQVVLSSGTVRKRRDIKVTVLDRREVIDALDRLDRLELVDEVVSEVGLRALVREGKQDSFPEGAIEVEESLKIQLHSRKDK